MLEFKENNLLDYLANSLELSGINFIFIVIFFIIAFVLGLIVLFYVLGRIHTRFAFYKADRKSDAEESALYEYEAIAKPKLKVIDYADDRLDDPFFLNESPRNL